MLITSLEVAANVFNLVEQELGSRNMAIATALQLVDLVLMVACAGQTGRHRRVNRTQQQRRRREGHRNGVRFRGHEGGLGRRRKHRQVDVLLIEPLSWNEGTEIKGLIQGTPIDT